MKNYSDFIWKKNKLYEGDIHWATLKPEKDKPKMWRIVWEGNGEASMDYFNKTRAMDNSVKMAVWLTNLMEEYVNRRPEVASEKPVDALKTKIGTRVAPTWN